MKRQEATPSRGELRREVTALRITAGDLPNTMVRVTPENSDLSHRSEQDE